MIPIHLVRNDILASMSLCHRKLSCLEKYKIWGQALGAAETYTLGRLITVDGEGSIPRVPTIFIDEL